MLTTVTEPPRFDERIEALMERGARLLAAERYEDARGTYLEAEGLARQLGSSHAEDRAFVSRSAVQMAIERGLPQELMQRHREILMSGEDPVNCLLAAYNIARAYEFAKEVRKGLFYAQIALDRSRLLDRPDDIASSHNQIGNFLLAQSRFEEACKEYEEGLALLPPDASVDKALILTNLGYARIVLGRSDGLSLIYQSLRLLHRLGARRETIFPHLDLCFGLLEVGSYRHALRHGVRALALAEEAGEHDSIKHALFLLGEVAQESGDPSLAREHFRRLQERYFPASPHLADLLLTVDVRKLINLKA